MNERKLGDMLHPQKDVRHFSRRTVLKSLAGSAVGLGLLGLAPATAFARGSVSAASVPLRRGQTLYTYKELSIALYSVDWSPDGTRIVTAGADLAGDNIATAWNALTGGNVVNYYGDGNIVYSGEWSPDGTRIASGAGPFGKIWDASSGTTLTTYTGHLTDPGHILTTIEWAPDGQRVASAGITFASDVTDDTTVQIWNPATGEHLLTYSGHTSDVTTLAWSPDGRWIASASRNRSVGSPVHVWDTQTGQLLLMYSGHTAPVNALAWSPDGTRVASASDDATVQIWNSQTGKGELMYRGHIASVNAVGWSPDGTLMASGSQDRSVQIWSPNSPLTLYYYYGNGADGPVNDVAWSPGGRLIASCTNTFPVTPTVCQTLVWAGR